MMHRVSLGAQGLKALLLLAVFGAAGTLFSGTNLVTNSDMATDDGVGLPVGWSTRVHPAETGGKISARPLGAGAFELNVRGRKSSYWWEQGGLTLVPEARYRLTCEYRTAGLDGGAVGLAVRNREWSKESSKLYAPSDTKGRWVAQSCEFTAQPTKRPDGYCIALHARVGKSGVLRAEVRSLRLEALDDATAAASKPMPSERLAKSVARIVPVDPLVSRVDAATGKMSFYWSRVASEPGCRLECRLERADRKPATATFDGAGYATVTLGKLKPGAHRISVTAVGTTGALLASNAYRIVAGTWKDPAKVGRRLNNFVTELVNAPLADGEVSFERAEDGWTWISFGGDVGDARGYLDDCPEAVVFRREGEDVVEAQRYLKAGVHKLYVRGAKGGRLRIHAVKIVMGGSVRGFDRRDCVFEKFGGYVFGLPFARKYGLLSGVNVLSCDGKQIKRQLADPYSVAIGYCLARGLQVGCGCNFGPNDPDRLTAESTYRRIARDVLGFVGGTSVDENGICASSLVSVNFSEAVWRIYDENPSSQVNVFYWDTSTGACYDTPNQHVSEISSVVNSGDGRGLLCPEFYMPVTSTREAFQQYVDGNAEFIASALRMVPASRGKTILYGSSYIMLGEWCNYFAPETDIKTQTAVLMHAYAVDPRYAECAGVGFGGIGCGNEEYVRWSMKLVRYYALEGGTEDLAAKYGYRWNPGIVKDPDFAKGLACWTAKPAEAGGVTADRIHEYGMRWQHRVGAPGGFGDTMAKFVLSEKGPNVLSQKLTGLVPGAYYSLQFNVSDQMAPQTKGNRWHLETMPFTLVARLDGGEEVRGLRYSHPICLSGSVPAESRERGMMHNERYVFRATASEATLTFADRADGKLTTDAGRVYRLNYVIFAPFYCDGDVQGVVDAIRGEGIFR